MSRGPTPDPDHEGGEQDSRPRVLVLAATPLLSLVIEPTPPDDAPQVHLHLGGQGLWLARMASVLEADVVVCGPFGGESGEVLAHLVEHEGIGVRPTPYAGANGTSILDHRDGAQVEVVRTTPSPLDRHEIDDLYGTVLVGSLDVDVVVVAGADPPTTLPADVFGRLADDLRATGRTVVADLSGEATRAVLGPGVDVLKMSHSEMLDGGFAERRSRAGLVDGARRMLADGVRAMVVSRAQDPTLVVTRERAVEVRVPHVTPVEHRGAGDSMTAGIAVGLGRGLDLEEAVRLGAAAGALNVARHGLGTGRREQIERFAHEVAVHEIT
ncbi:PfkB family carbohydrate kinase [Actinotalea sp. K2]|uniref:1-phosphofructokinase family hexose kinase n=1 Tax=Actinotalea sp. K2 TaxID=2939438 RepID=UPI0020179733|nr:PfkB family carbohydrate kinase [Actinotalea sp. K2]MCL3861414.1 PfkB family carbohydrate kinase [Actinotalea sp. K2]